MLTFLSGLLALITHMAFTIWFLYKAPPEYHILVFIPGGLFIILWIPMWWLILGGSF